MQLAHRFPVLILTALAITASCTLALADDLAFESGGKLWLDGKSSVHEYKCTASSLKATLVQNDAVWPANATGGEAVERFVRAKGVKSMEVVVVVTSLHSGKAGLDKNMYKALKASAHPEICYRMTGYEVADGAKPGEMAIDAKGTLSVAGVEREIRMPVTAVREGKNVRLRGSTPLLMSQFGIKPPTMMMGTLRTADQVVINFDLLLGAKVPTDGVSKSE